MAQKGTKYSILQKDEDVARWLSEAGCRHVQMGIQTMDEEFKRKSVKRYEKSDQVSDPDAGKREAWDGIR